MMKKSFLFAGYPLIVFLLSSCTNPGVSDHAARHDDSLFRAQTNESTCGINLIEGTAPEISDSNIAIKTHKLCYKGYAALESGLTRTPLWSAEHLTEARILSAKKTKRKNSFHHEESLPPSERAELKDYAKSGFDRGHLAPSGDMPDLDSQEESFSLANILPQTPDNNEHLWEKVEERTRELAIKDKEIWVVTGVSFRGEKIRWLKGRVAIPRFNWKAIYDPVKKAAAAYITPNDRGQKFEIVSIEELIEKTGIDPFPSLPENVKLHLLQLEPPRRSRRSHASN